MKKSHLQLFDRVPTALFFLCIALPALILLGSPPKDMELKYAEPTMVAPKLPTTLASAVAWPAKYKTYLAKNFGFRRQLIEAYAELKFSWLGESVSALCAVGKNDWIFYTADNELACAQRTSLFSEPELQLWAQVMEERTRWLHGLGISYIFTVAPDKHTIYPEQLPKSMTFTQPQSRLDQLTDYLRKHASVTVVDVREALMQGKSQREVYFKTDTHWNQFGGWVAYQQIAKALSAWYPHLRVLQAHDFDFVVDTAPCGMIATLGLNRLEHRETFERMPSKRPLGAVIQPAFAQHCPHEVETVSRFIPRVVGSHPGGSIEKLLMFRDSFATPLIPLLAEHAKQSVFLWEDFNVNAIVDEKPTVVIQELVERALMSRVPTKLDIPNNNSVTSR